MLRFLLNLYPSAPVTAAERKQRQDATVNRLIKKYASGNIRLQQGQIITGEEAAKMKRNALRHKFTA